MSFPKQKKPHSWRVLQDWVRHYADQEELPQSREDIDGFTYSRDEPVQIRSTSSFRVNIIIDYKGRRWGKVQFEVAPVEVEAVLDIDQVEPFDIGQFGLESPGRISVVGLPYLLAQKLHACTEALTARRTRGCMT